MADHTLHLDFETYCELDVRQVGAHRYSEHPSCEVLILCYRLPGKRNRFWLPHRDGPELPADLVAYVEADEGTLTAHNAQFEACVWQNVLVARHDAPKVAPRRWRCTAARAAAAGMPRALANLGPALRLRVTKDREGTRLINIFCKPRKPTKNIPATRIYPDDKPEEFQAFVNYCGTDVDTEALADEQLPDLSDYEWRVYRHTELMNSRGLPLDMDAVRAGYQVLQVLEKRVVQKVEALTGGIRPTQRDKMLEFFNGLGLEMENTQAKTIKDLVLLKGDELEPKTKELLLLRIEGGKASTKKLKKMLQVVCDDGCVRGAFLYWGASTGRLAGRLIQPQNFTRGEYKPHQLYALFDLLLKHRDADVFEILYEWPIDALAQGMRGYIKAPQGKKFVVVDFAAIEARVLVWLARQMDAIEAYVQNADMYKRLAVRLYHLQKEDDVQDWQRKFAKDIWLGSGFQLGWVGFISNCLKRGIVVSEEDAKSGIGTYRDSNPRVVGLWADVEASAIQAVLTSASSTKPVMLRNIAFFVDGIWFCIRLPSGRLLRYPYPEVQNTLRFRKPVKKLTYRSEIKGKWVREGTYGGKLVENIVQAIARDLMVNACFNAEAKGYKIVGTVHDELIALVDEGFGNPHELEDVLRMKPKWATDCPVNAEGWEGIRYRK
jgi:DNA polymerase bacteriophage-type